MATPNRATLLNKLQRVLRKHYKPVAPADERPVLEHLLFACCLENAPYDTAAKALASLEATFFDWNEIRVSTAKELADVMPMLPDSLRAATNLKQVLQSVFESTYSFELESLKKQNLGQAVKKLKKLEGVTEFAAAYVTQIALGGHSIPVDRGAADAMVVIGLASPSEAEQGRVAGLERAVSKRKGVEVGSLLHQLSADFVANPYSPALHKILLEVSPDAQERLPKRPSRKRPTPQPAAPKPATPKSSKKAAATKSSGKKSAGSTASRSKAIKTAKPSRTKAKPTKTKAAKTKRKTSTAKKSTTSRLAKRKPR